MSRVKENVEKILRELPPQVQLIVATKARSVSQIQQAHQAGITKVGENYVREAEAKYAVLGPQLEWHLIGHLQKNKVKKAVRLFDMIQTLDSLELAYLIDRECEKIHKRMPVLIEVNIASESQKKGVLPSSLEDLIQGVRSLKNIHLLGLMTMGPLREDVEQLRPYFQQLKKIFDEVKTKYTEHCNWSCLSMGMSTSFRIAIEEGATMVRIGSSIFE